jgi:HAMP domain-containing protein
MRPARIELDYVQTRRRPARASWVLLAAALAFAGEAGFSFVEVRSKVAAKLERMAHLADSLPARDPNAGPVRQPPLEEFAAARDTIVRLSMPWSNIFRALEGARSEDVALLSIEPDAASGAVGITGEAKSYPAALTYVAWLSHEKTLKDVRLAKHEVRQGDPRRPVAFTISAHWRDGP